MPWEIQDWASQANLLECTHFFWLGQDWWSIRRAEGDESLRLPWEICFVGSPLSVCNSCLTWVLLYSGFRKSIKEPCDPRFQSWTSNSGFSFFVATANDFPLQLHLDFALMQPLSGWWLGSESILLPAEPLPVSRSAHPMRGYRRVKSVSGFCCCPQSQPAPLYRSDARCSCLSISVAQARA